MTRLEEKHPLAIRWFHWVGFPLLLPMVWSGVLVYWANDVYRVGLGGITLFHFFPDWVYVRLGIPQRLAEGMAMGSVVTGLAIYKPAQLPWLTGLLGGYPMARWEHFWLMAGFVSFFVVHVAQVIRAGWDNFRSMVAGYSLVRSKKAPDEQTN
jgi:hypothetical protein